MSWYFYLFLHLLILINVIVLGHFLLKKIKSVNYKGEEYIKPLTVFISLFLYLGIRTFIFSPAVIYMEFIKSDFWSDIIALGIMFPFISGTTCAALMILPADPRNILTNRINLMLSSFIMFFYIDCYLISFIHVFVYGLLPNSSFAIGFLIVLIFMARGKPVSKKNDPANISI